MVTCEEWRDVCGYEGIYQVSNLGRIRSLDRYCRGMNGCKIFHHGKILSQSTQKNGYKYIHLKLDGTQKSCRVHRIVAEAFVDNPNGYAEVNHIDENKANNRADNLEWCTRSYNCSYGSGLSVRASKCSKPCIQYKDGVEIARYPSIAEASRRTGIVFSCIQACVSGKGKTTHGFTWSPA